MIEQPLEPSSIAFAVAIMAMGSALQASAGVGLALFVVPLLALVDRSFIPGPYAACRPPDHPVDGLSGADSHRRLGPAELADRTCSRYDRRRADAQIRLRLPSRQDLW